MAETNDHDLLVRLDTKVELIIDLISKYENRQAELAERVAALEVKDSKDSEKFRAITADVQRSLDNHAAIQRHAEKLDAMDERIDSVVSTGKLYDTLIAIGAILGFIATIIWGK